MPSNKNQNQAQSNQYDKILHENLEITLPVIIREVLGLDIIDSEELPDDIQHTKERKPDALKKVTDSSGSTYVLQIVEGVKAHTTGDFAESRFFIKCVSLYSCAAVLYHYLIALWKQ